MRTTNYYSTRKQKIENNTSYKLLKQVKLNMLGKIDFLNFQFTFKYYLYKNNLDQSVCDYLENNSIKNNYVCFHDEIKDNVHYLVTTKLDRDAENGYKIITILINNDDILENRIVYNSDWKFVVYYNNYIIRISNMLELGEIEKFINFNSDSIKNKKMKILPYIDKSSNQMYLNTVYLQNKNINIDKILYLCTSNLDLLSIFPNIKEINYIYPGMDKDTNQLKQEIRQFDFSQAVSSNIVKRVYSSLVQI
jgi:hypothetical protein